MKLKPHPLTWWIWSAALAIGIARANNFWHSILIVGVVSLVVLQNKEDAPWSKSFLWSAKIALIVIMIRLSTAIVIGVPIPGTKLFTLPHLPLPSWMPGIRIGGPVMLERITLTLHEAIVLAGIIMILGAAASLTSPNRLLRVLPIYIYEVGVAVVIATTLVPQLVSSVYRIRQAQKLRGQKERGLSAWKRVAIPVLEESLARALDLAAAMDSRGYGYSRKRSRYRPISWRAADSIVALASIASFISPYFLFFCAVVPLSLRSRELINS